MPTKRDVALGAAKGARFIASSGVKLAGRAAGITAGLTAAAIATTASGGKNATSSISAGLIAGNAVGGKTVEEQMNFVMLLKKDDLEQRHIKIEFKNKQMSIRLLVEKLDNNTFKNLALKDIKKN